VEARPRAVALGLASLIKRSKDDMAATNKQVRKEAELEKARREKEHREFKEAQVRRHAAVHIPQAASQQTLGRRASIVRRSTCSHAPVSLAAARGRAAACTGPTTGG
jgi:hypothetical protein